MSEKNPVKIFETRIIDLMFTLDQEDKLIYCTINISEKKQMEKISSRKAKVLDLSVPILYGNFKGS
jgi:hypothetical protein